MLLEHLNAGHLHYSSSPWVSLAFLVSKGNGKFCMVCNFHALNNATVPDMYPMGNIQDILHHAVCKGKIFAKLDCKDAFFQTLMKEEDIPKMAITTPLGLLEWVVMPQGIHNNNALATQQCHINEALQGLTGECCKAYVDDIIIWGKDAKDLHDCWWFIPVHRTMLAGENWCQNFNSAQCNYPVHDCELLVIINALNHWHPLLYGVPVHVYCDHFMLQWFHGQHNLSPCQLCWLKYPQGFDLCIEYIKGEYNTLVDYLSQHTPCRHYGCLTMFRQHSLSIREEMGFKKRSRRAFEEVYNSYFPSNEQYCQMFYRFLSSTTGLWLLALYST